MSKQFDFLADRLLDFLCKSGIRPGDRFYAELDSNVQTSALFSALEKRLEDISLQIDQTTFHAKHYRVDNKKVIVVSTSDGLTLDFVVTLRNRVSNQTGDFINTCLVILSYESIGSIKDGSKNLKDVNMPLHFESIKNEMAKFINESSISMDKKAILMFSLSTLLEDKYVRTSLEDYFPILNCIQKATIDIEDLVVFELFVDNGLDQIPEESAKIKRLTENHRMYNQIKSALDDDDEKTLEKLIGSENIAQLIKGNLPVTRYQDVYNWKNKYQGAVQKLEIISITHGESKILVRNVQNDYSIIVFKANLENNLVINFSNKLSDNFAFQAKSGTLKHDIFETKIHVQIDKLYETRYFNISDIKYVDSKYMISVLVLPLDESFFAYVKDRLRLGKRGRILVSGFDDFLFGNPLAEKKAVIIESIVDNISMSASVDNYNLVFGDDLKSLDEYNLKVNIDSSIIYLDIQNDDSIERVHTNLLQLNNDIRKKKTSAHFRGTSVSHDGVSNIQLDQLELKMLSLERKFTEEKCSHIKDQSSVPLDLPEEISVLYSRLLDYYNENDTLPSLAFLDDEISTLLREYVDKYIEELSNIKEDIPLKDQGLRYRDLSLLGVVIENENYYLSPFHPLLVAYNLRLNEVIKNENVPVELMQKINANNLLPYIYNSSNELLECSQVQNCVLWVSYSKLDSRSNVRENITSNIVYEKLTQFKMHFSMLFLGKSKAPILLNIVNIKNDQEILRGIVKFIGKELVEKNNPETITPITIHIYNGRNSETSFDSISHIKHEIDIPQDIIVEIKKLNIKIDYIDFVRILLDKINYYKFDNDFERFEYAHISFVKLDRDKGRYIHKTKELVSGSQLSGLVNTKSYQSNESGFKIGYGSKYAPENSLLKVAHLINEFYSNQKDSGKNAYGKGNGILTSIDELNSKYEKIYDASNWVTFLDPEVDFHFFSNVGGNLLIIHYTDQLSSFKKLDSITLTNKTANYLEILKNYLEKYDVKYSKDDLLSAISSYNCINGEWLLRSIARQNSPQFGREKLSIISGVKYMLSILDAPEVYWIPISLEEILRVTRMTSLDTLKAEFSVSNLDEHGPISDDILMLGLHKIGDDIHVYFYPIEVKIGKNEKAVYSKAKTQIKSLVEIFKKHIMENDTFTGRYYLNLFIQMGFANLQLMKDNELWKDKQFTFTESDYISLNNGDFVIGNDLYNLIGMGAVLSFKKETEYKSVSMDENIMIVERSESDGYTGIIADLDDLREFLTGPTSDIDKNYLLNEKMKSHIFSVNDEQIQRGVKAIEPVVVNVTNEIARIAISDDKKANSDVAIVAGESTQQNNNQKEIERRILIGTPYPSTKGLYWEFGHRGLSNRHILISGTSGQGKTYLIQCMLMELSRQGVSGIVFDYTQGFTASKLEPEFISILGEKIIQENVYREKIKINPFLKHDFQDEGEFTKEKDVIVAQRITDIFAHVYSFGDQQFSALYQCCLNGIRKFGDRMNMNQLRTELVESEIKEAKTVFSKLLPFFDSDFFGTESKIDWSDWIYSDGVIRVIQMKNIPNTMQTVLTEFILWDLWNYIQKIGEEGKPFVVVLDEAQNLSFKDDAPASKILTEGRKFGWSAWFATQFLKGQLKPEEISRLQNAAEKIYFLPPDNEIQDIAARLSNSENKKDIEKILKTLEKGKCVVDGFEIVDGKLRRHQPKVVTVAQLMNR